MGGPNHQPKGVRYGGRAKGTPNKRTAELLNGALERGPGAPLAKEVLEELMLHYLGKARVNMALPGEQETPEQEAGLQHWGMMAAEVARMLAPYQSPTLKAIMTNPAPQEAGQVTKFVLSIFERKRQPIGPPDLKLIEGTKGNGKDE